MIALPPNTTISYQRDLADFVVANDLHNLVETGLGVSSVFLLDAIDRMGEGRLTSVDPKPWYYSNAAQIQHPKWTWIKDTAAAALYTVAGPWDMMLHDSDHDVFNQTLEYNFAWGMLRKGGWLVSDDSDWGQHGAWRRFLAEKCLTPTKMNAVEMVQKPHGAIRAENIPTYFSTCLGWAQDAEMAWLRSGGKNSDAFKEYRRGY